MPAAAVLPGSMSGPVPNQSSSPMMPGFVTASQMSHDQQVVSRAQMVIGQQQIQMVQQPMSVAQMQVAFHASCLSVLLPTTSAPTTKTSPLASSKKWRLWISGTSEITRCCSIANFNFNLTLICCSNEMFFHASNRNIAEN